MSDVTMPQTELLQVSDNDEVDNTPTQSDIMSYAQLEAVKLEKLKVLLNLSKESKLMSNPTIGPRVNMKIAEYVNLI